MSCNPIRRFCLDEDGAVTIDWVVLTGGLLIFGVLAAASVSRAATDLSGGVGARLGSAAVPNIDFDGP